MSAQELSDEYEKDKEAATKKYAGSVVQLTGVVRNAQRAMVFLDVKNDKTARGITCNTRDPEPFAKVSRGQKIKIKGELVLEFGLTLRDCELVDPGPL